MQVALAGRGVTLSRRRDQHHAGPVARLDSAPTIRENARRRRACTSTTSSARSMHGFYQGWDLHPGQLPTRYAAVYAFFLEASTRPPRACRNFVEKAAQATLVGDVFDDAATGQGLLNFFLRGINCGAFTEAEAITAGRTLDELRGRSFVKILENRRAHVA